MRQLLRASLLWLSLPRLVTNAAAADDYWSATTSSAESKSSSPGAGTCISRTVNCITHTLPQQCLRTDRSTPTTGNGTGAISNASQPETSDTVPPASSEASTEVTSLSVNIVIYTDSFANQEGSVQSSKASSSLSVATVEPEPEEDSPLDNANFLSFEEWKKQNLAKAGQSPENLGQEGLASRDRQRPGINNALDSLGEENEIDLDFSGFGGARPVSSASTQTSETSSEIALQSTLPNSLTLRSKDAGKTCKERTNYASFDCAAGIMKNNPECKSASSILVENKDSYMLNVCSAPNKFFIVELCNDILIDTIVLANYEFFSSVFRHFRVSVADRYPVKPDKWKDLGTFEARNTREIQAFLVENPLIWARYLRIEFLSHYGSEYYCPVSLLRVHGTTMMEEFRHQEELARGEIVEDEPNLEAEVPPTSPVQQEPLLSTDEPAKSTVEAIPPVQTGTATESSAAEATDNGTSMVSDTSEELVGQSTQGGSTNTATAAVQASDGLEATRSTFELRSASNSSEGKCRSQILPAPVHEPYAASASCTVELNTSSPLNSTSVSETPVTPSYSLPAVNISSSTTEPATSSITANVESASIMSNTTSGVFVTSGNSSSRQPSSRSQEALANATDTFTNATKATSATSPAPHQPQPTTQESFFKSVHKRLQQLESNSTLSLQYIEEQSRILRDAFNKVEKRQVAATEKFLSHLNDTVMGELHGFRQAYDQLWQSTVIELEGQSEQYQREMLALSTRLTLVADELLWQKRMGIVQSTLLLLCLGLVLFARQGNGYLEMPFAQQCMHKSQAASRTGWESEAHSPLPAGRSPVSLLRRRLWRTKSEADVTSEHGTDAESRQGEEGEEEGEEGVELQLSPPTSMMNGEDSEEDDGEVGSVDEELGEGMRMQSGPATPNGRVQGLKRLPGDVGVLSGDAG